MKTISKEMLDKKPYYIHPNLKGLKVYTDDISKIPAKKGIDKSKYILVTMETVTLKLTDNEMMFLDISTDISKLNKGFEEEYVYLCKNSAKRMDIDLLDNEYLIQDVDKFREFLNDEMLHHFTMADDDIVIHKNLKSILSKLDKEVK